MGEIDIAAELRKDNPTVREMDLRIYADAMRTYSEAAKNVATNGAICTHPRTGSPMENPYLKIQAQQGAILTRMRTIKSNRVAAMLEA